MKSAIFNTLIPPNPLSDGRRVAMIEHNGVPIELTEFDPNNLCKNRSETELSEAKTP